jgi:hypothetical protein
LSSKKEAKIKKKNFKKLKGYKSIKEHFRKSSLSEKSKKYLKVLNSTTKFFNPKTRKFKTKK